MKPIITRSLSGIVYVALILFAILSNSYVFAIFFATVSVLTTCEFHKLTNRQEGVNVMSWLGASASMVLFGFLFFSLKDQQESMSNLYETISTIFICIYFGLCFFAFIFEIFRKQPNPVHNIAYLFLGQIYIALPFAMTSFLKIELVGFENCLILLALFVIIWINDTFAYLVGSLIGKHRLCERISPKKSWEGFFGGMVGALLAGYAFSLFVNDLGVWQWFGFALIVVVFGTLGDLLESLIKRTMGVKDSGNIMPGHGGFLDRLDSVIVAVIPICIYLMIIS